MKNKQDEQKLQHTKEIAYRVMLIVLAIIIITLYFVK